MLSCQYQSVIDCLGDYILIDLQSVPTHFPEFLQINYLRDVPTVVSTDCQSDKIATTTNSLTIARILA